MAEKHWDVYISYGHEDSAWVAELAGNLHRKGFEVFLDEWELIGGDRVTGRLEEAIRQTRHGVLVVSPHALSRPWVREEYEALLRQGVEDPSRRLIPVLYRDVELPVIIANRVWVDFREAATGPPYDDALERLARFLRGQAARDRPERGAEQVWPTGAGRQSPRAGKAMERVRVVLVSPGDVLKERAAAQTVIDELNRGVAEAFNCHLSLWRWETDARPGMHLDGPQGLIDELMDICDADVVVGVFWKRFGTPTSDANSGTEHELHRAWVAWTEQRYPEVMVYFCTRPYAPTTIDELAHWQRVIEFRGNLPAQQLWWEYEGVSQFATLVREHLTRFLVKRVPRLPPSLPGSRSAELTAAPQPDRTDHKLRQLQEWKHLLEPEVVVETQQKLLDSWMER